MSLSCGIVGLPNVEFFAHFGPVRQHGADVAVRQRAGQNLPLDGENLTGLSDGLLETAGDLRERREEQVPEAHALQ